MAKNQSDHQGDFLPASAEEVRLRGWDQPDIILITGDAYVDHPSFGVALIGRWLERCGYRVAILAQPDWQSVEPFRQMGRPRLFWGITSGSVDSRLNHYVPLGHRRDRDAFSPGGKMGLRPDKPLLVYSARARQAYPEVPIILGGLEASLRRLVHYDYIEDQLKRSVLIDAKADLLVYGMGELAIQEIARRLNVGQTIEQITDVAGTAYPLTRGRAAPGNAVELPSLSQQQGDADLVMKAHLMYQEQAHPAGCCVIQSQDPVSIAMMPPANPLTAERMDDLYDLPFRRQAHPRYAKAGGVPALETVRFSIVSHRGCFGGCAFCSLYYHQGKQISSRSPGSILQEAEVCRRHPEFRGTISDVGGPTANMYGMRCTRLEPCTRSSCLFPGICRHLSGDATALMTLMDRLLTWKTDHSSHTNLFIASGIRHDLALKQKDYMKLLIGHFVGGHLKVAPEHFCPHVLDLMQKPGFEFFEEFESRFYEISRASGKRQFIVPYFISSHPGCSPEDALKLMEYLVERNWQLRQVQDYTPIPMTLSSAMYVSGKNSRGREIYVSRGRKEKKLQAALMQYHLPPHQKIVMPFLAQQGRQKLIGIIKTERKKTSPSQKGKTVFSDFE